MYLWTTSQTWSSSLSPSITATLSTFAWLKILSVCSDVWAEVRLATVSSFSSVNNCIWLSSILDTKYLVFLDKPVIAVPELS